MSVDLKVTHYDTGEDYFTYTIDRSVSYDFDEYELSQISCMYLDRCLIKYLNRDYWEEGEEDHAKEVVENVKKAIQFLIEYGTLSNPKKGEHHEQRSQHGKE